MSQVIILSKKSRKCKHFLPVFLLFLLFCYSTLALRPHTVTATPSSFWKRSLLTYRYTASSTEYFQAVRIMYRWILSILTISLSKYLSAAFVAASPGRRDRINDISCLPDGGWQTSARLRDLITQNKKCGGVYAAAPQ